MLPSSLKLTEPSMEISSFLVNPESKWAITVEGNIIVIPNIVIEEIRANPTHVMGWFNPILAKAWKFIFPLTEASARMGTIALTDPAWQLMEQPWWVFKSDILEKTEARTVAWRNVSQQPSPTPLLCEFNLMLEALPISTSVMGNKSVTKLIQVLHPTIEFSFHSCVTEVMMGVLQHCVTLIPGRGYSKEMMRRTGWNLREEARLLPPAAAAAADECPSCSLSPMMNIIIWNCRGALKPSFQSNVRDMVSNHNPAILVVMETRLDSDKAKEITDRLPFRGAIHTDTVGFAGGLWLLWDPDRVEVTNLTSTEQEIHTLVKMIDLRKNKWQQKGLIPSPHTPVLMMHKAEKKYEVGKVTDEEQAKQRQLKAILNKLSPQNFDKLFNQVKAVNIDNLDTLTGVISQIFDIALMEPTFCEIYANFCSHLSLELPDFSKDNEKITFKRVLLNKCQKEFEWGEREQEEANKAYEEGEIKQSAEEREEKRIKARRRMLGNIRLIGELYKKKMLTERIMHACIQKMLGHYDNPDEEDIEALCNLMSTVGEMIDHFKSKENMDAYFERMKMFSNNMNLSSRVRFMLKDLVDLRKNKWQHQDAAQEQQAQTSRLGQGNINTSTRTPMDFGSRGSTKLSPSSAQMGDFRGLPNQACGFGGQDVRFEDRVPYDARTLSVPLPQRPIGDDSIALGPQGGLARGISIRGSPAMSSAPAAELSPGVANSRRMAVGLKGYSMVSEWTTYGTREELVPRYIPDRFDAPAAYDRSRPQERNLNYVNRALKNPDRRFDRSVVTSPTPRMEGAAVPQNVPSERLPEERLKDMSIASIKEFYSVRDEKEVELCIRDMNAPSFHPSMVSLWVTDSFERKDVERDVLTKLLVNLTKSRDGVLSQAQLIKGFESVMTNLEDAIIDAPRAPEFLGRLFAKVITENVVPLSEIGRLIYQGGEEPGCLLEFGLAADVLGSTLEVIKSEKGDYVFNELRTSSNLRIEDFRPPNPNRSRILDKFIYLEDSDAFGWGIIHNDF